MKMYKDEAKENPKDSFDEYTARDQPVVKSFYDRHGYDERDGPPDEEEKRGYVDDSQKPLEELNYRRR